MNLINDILDYSKIEAGKLELESIELDIPELLDSIISLMAKSAERRRTRLHSKIAENVPLQVRGWSDLTLANLEAPVVSQARLRDNKRYNLRTDVSALDLFGSRSVLSLANNHIMDYGDKGLAETIAALNASDIVHAGAGQNLEEARKPALIDVGGVKVAVLCCADPRFQAATAHRAGTCPATIELVDASVRELRATNDIVIVSVHMGIEFFPVPSQRQLD